MFKLVNSRFPLGRGPIDVCRRYYANLIGDGAFLPPKSKYKVTVVGAGNSAHVIAGYAGSMHNVEVSMLNTVAHENEKLKNNMHKRMTVKHRNGQDDIIGKISVVSDNPAEVIPHADLVLMAVPAHIHEHYFRLMAPYVQPNLSLGVVTAQGCLDLVARNIFQNKFDFLNFFSFETLPWACRLVEHGLEAEVLGTKLAVDVAAHPYNMTSPACRVLTQLISRGEPYSTPQQRAQFLKVETGKSSSSIETSSSTDLSPSVNTDVPQKRPVLIAGPNQLAVTMMNINSVWHPCITYGQFHAWDGHTPFTEAPPFYEGVDDFTADILDKVSNEILTLKEALLKEHPHLNLDVVRHVYTWLLEAYGDNIADSSSLRSCLTTNIAYAGLKHPMVPAPVSGDSTGASAQKGEMKLVPNKAHRFWVEDLPCGMLATRGIAELAGVDTPTMDTVIQWMQELKGKEYLVSLPGGKRSLVGKDLCETRAPQRYGITTLSGIIHEYEHK